MTEAFYTSDLHLGDQRAAERRGFNTTRATRHASALSDHDQAIADHWCSVVRKRDTVTILGDLAILNPVYSHPWILDLIFRLPGTKHLIAGNHDRCHPMHRGWEGKLRGYLSVFQSVGPFARRKIDGRNVLLSHFPYTADHTEPAPAHAVAATRPRGMATARAHPQPRAHRARAA